MIENQYRPGKSFIFERRGSIYRYGWDLTHHRSPSHCSKGNGNSRSCQRKTLSGVSVTRTSDFGWQAKVVSMGDRGCSGACWPTRHVCPCKGSVPGECYVAAVLRQPFHCLASAGSRRVRSRERSRCRMFPRAARKVVAESVMNRLAPDGAAWPPTADLHLLPSRHTTCRHIRQAAGEGLQ